MNRDPGSPVDVVDILGVGFGPSNLALALAVQEHNERAPDSSRIRASFVEQQAAFGWHRGMLLDGATMQVSFLKDLVTMRDPTSPRSYLNYLQGQGRLADFINNKSLFPSRVEFHDYLEWCAADVRHLVSYGTRAVAVHPVTGPDGEIDQIDVVLRDAQGDAAGSRVVRTRNLVLATGLVPWLPEGVQRGTRIWHNSELLSRLGRAPARRSAPPPLRRHRRRAERGGDDGAPARPRGRRRGALRVLPLRLQPGRRHVVRQPHLRSRGRRPLLRGLRRGQADAARLPRQHQLLGGRPGADRRALPARLPGAGPRAAAPARARGVAGVERALARSRRRRRRARGGCRRPRHRGRRRGPDHRPPPHDHRRRRRLRHRLPADRPERAARRRRGLVPAGRGRRAAGRPRLPAAHRRAAHAPASTCRDPPSTPTGSARRCSRPRPCGRARSSTRCSATGVRSPTCRSPTRAASPPPSGSGGATRGW